MGVQQRGNGGTVLLTSHLSVVAQGAGLVDTVLFEQLLVPGAAIQRIPQTHKLPVERNKANMSINWAYIHKKKKKKLKTTFNILQENLPKTSPRKLV